MLAGGKWLRLAMTLGVLGSLFSWTGCGDSGPKVKRFAFITNGNDPFWDALNSGLMAGKEEFKLEANGYDVKRYVNNAKATGQIDLLRQFNNDPEIAGVAISVIEAKNAALMDEMKKLKAKGVKVITVDADVERTQFRDARSFYIGTENFTGGKTLGTAAKALLESKGVKKGGYAQFAGFTTVDNARQRMDGVKEALGEDYEELDRMADQMNHSVARDNVRTALTNHDDIKMLVGIWAYNAPAIADVVKERGVREKTIVATFDAQEAAVTKMAEGDIDVMVVQDPFDMGKQTVRLLKAMVEDNKDEVAKMFPNADQPDGDIYTTGLKVVVPDSDSPVKEDMFDKKTVTYLTLEQFQKWLAQYGLKSS